MRVMGALRLLWVRVRVNSKGCMGDDEVISEASMGDGEGELEGFYG